MPVVTFRLAPTIHKRFFEVCEERETTVSAVLQRAVEGFIDRVADQPKRATPPTSDPVQAAPRGNIAGLAMARAKDRSIIGFSPTTGEPIYSLPSYQKKGK